MTEQTKRGILASLGMVWDWIDNRQIVRRLMSLGTFALTVHVMAWTLHFAEASERTGGEIAGIIGAIWAPLAMLQGYMFGRGENPSPVVITDRRDPAARPEGW